MQVQNQNPELAVFIHAVFGSKEIGLIIAEDESEQEGFAASLDGMGFVRSKNAGDLVKFPKTYLILEEEMDRDVYNFLVQYPTGQIQMFDSKTMRSKVMAPDYNLSTAVIMVTKSNILKLRAKGYEALSLAGPAYQS